MGASRARIARIAVMPATFVLMAAAAPSALATDRWVPKAYKTIQDAINASKDGDRVRVQAGTYHENVNMLGKSISVRSEGPGRATIDGDFLGACVTLDSGTPTASLHGFRLIEGTGQLDAATGESFGGGICQTTGDLTIADCIIAGCEATWGGALFVGKHSKATVTGCLLDRCNRKAAYNHGGGIAVVDSTLGVGGTTIQDCGTTRYTSDGGGIHAHRSEFTCLDTLITLNAAGHGGGLWLETCSFYVTASFVGNVAMGSGGGAAVYRSGGAIHGTRNDCVFDRCDFTYNAADRTSTSEGGGLWLVESRVDLHHCDLHYNRSKKGGALATVLGSDSNIHHCSFRGNSARAGGGIYANAAYFDASNSIIAENTALFSPPQAGDGGGGICSFGSSFVLTLCTVTENRALAKASGIYHSGPPPSPPGWRPLLSASIVWGNGGPGLARNIDDHLASSPMGMSECDYELSDDPHRGRNFQVDPLFDPASFVFDLLAISPLVDVITTLHGTRPGYDFDGDPRVLDNDGDGVARRECGAQELW